MARKSEGTKHSLEIDYCWLCGLFCPPILQVAHLDQDRTNNAASNLAILCPTCHRLYDVDLIPRKWIFDYRAKHRVRRSPRLVLGMWARIEAALRRGKTANWDVLIKHGKSRGTLAALKAHRSRRKR